MPFITNFLLDSMRKNSLHQRLLWPARGRQVRACFLTYPAGGLADQLGAPRVDKRQDKEVSK